ncbi:MAG: hypothetical protein CL907_00085 [Dehalococcoidia bacterium]|nr:hypothetical protein [Dehalococcoidia bacterium]|tara:strand:- start:3387 stop:4610 length:1224 start_codon:yes stop_codon:yes gene_type:complete
MKEVFNSILPNDDSKVEEILDLGTSPLANGLIRKGDKVDSFPLKLGRCDKSGHVQLTTFIEPSEMFKNYLYISSVSSTLEAHLKSISQFICDFINIENDSLCVDIGSNDGTLLSGFLEKGKRVLGVDPAENLSKLAKDKGVETYTGYFGETTSKDILAKYGKAKVITLTNTFPHLQNLSDFMKGVSTLIEDDGVLFLEAHYLADIYDQIAFDTIYHEHVSYWHLQPIIRMFKEFGFEIKFLERLPLHHGQLRVVASKSNSIKQDNSVKELIEWENENQIGSKDKAIDFATNSLRIKDELNLMIKELKSTGKKIAGYGAPAKATTLMNFLNLDKSKIDFVSDRSNLKQGLIIPGTGIEIFHPDKIYEDKPDYLILFAWNFKDEIIKQLDNYKKQGGKLIIPIPKVEII